MGSWGTYLKIRNNEINAFEAGLELFSGVILARFLKCYDVISLEWISGWTLKHKHSFRRYEILSQSTIEFLIFVYHTLLCFIVQQNAQQDKSSKFPKMELFSAQFFTIKEY